MKINQGVIPRESRDYFHLEICDFARQPRIEKYWQRRRSYTRGYNQNANRFKNKRCKSIEIGCKRLNIAWRRGSLKSITGDYQGKVTPLAWGLWWRAARSLNKTPGVGGSFCKYCYCHPAGNFASHMSSHRCSFWRIRARTLVALELIAARNMRDIERFSSKDNLKRTENREYLLWKYH